MKRLGLILFILVVVYFIFLIRQDIIDNLELKSDVRRLTKSIAQEKQSTEQMQKKLKQLQSNSYIEKLARTRLGLVKKGETAYKVIGGEK
ncbi:septum formation initiator family protein [Candidatus Margulisiibacteriota bacterium]